MGWTSKFDFNPRYTDAVPKNPSHHYDLKRFHMETLINYETKLLQYTGAYLWNLRFVCLFLIFCFFLSNFVCY